MQLISALPWKLKIYESDALIISMKRSLELAEYISSKLGHPPIAIRAANHFLDRQNLELQEGAHISKNCKVRGRIRLGPHSKLSEDCVLMGDIEIGKQTNLNQNSEIIGDVKIGKYCAIARNTLFQQNNHETSKPAMQMRFYNQVLNSKLEHVSKGPITIGNDVWIGARAIILSGVSIGDGAIIGAGSVVTNDVEPYSVVAGVPASRVKWRFPQSIRERLVKFAWWDYDEDVLRKNADFFHQKIESKEDIPVSF